MVVEVSICALISWKDRVCTPPYRKTPVVEVTAGETWFDSTKPLSSIDLTPEVAISWLKRIVPWVSSEDESLTNPVT